MARVLIVGCGCRGQELARELGAGDGHAVRGTTRDSSRIPDIEAAGGEGVLADPDRLATLLPLLEGVTVVCWLMGTADDPALHGDRLESLLAKLVDSGVRGLVYEGAGTVDAELLSAGAALVRRAGPVHAMPVVVTEADPAEVEAWTAGMRAAIDEVLAG